MFKKWKEKRKIEEDKRRIEHNIKLSKALKELEVKKKIMTSTQCAIRDNMGRCRDDCVHFQEGEVIKLPMYKGKSYEYYVACDHAKCKLWK